VHAIGHCLSVKWDIAHGASLSVAYPAWLKLQKDRIPERIAELGEVLFQADSPEETIEQLSGLFRQFGCPVSLSEAGISPDQAAQNELLQIMFKNDVNGLHHKLTPEDHRLLLNYMSEG
jgi:alcohol dehydrogenase YqhD (iron-dependent ADH family)